MNTPKEWDKELENQILSKFAIIQRAIQVMENHDEAIEWLITPQYGLGGYTPWIYADKENGVKEVMQLLGRIEQGVY